MEPLVSIIVPVYNVELYLPSCIASIQRQTYQNLEIILIDDGSTDQCGQLCDQYARSDSRIKNIHKTNGGAASAKNIGLSMASGEYIVFVDSDDYVDDTYVECLLSHLNRTGADVVQCRFRNVFVDHSTDRYTDSQERLYQKEEFLSLFLSFWPCSIFWNKMFKRHVLENVRFIEGHVIDDEYFTYLAIINADFILDIPIPLYSYRMRKSSVMQSPKTKIRILYDKLDYVTKRYEVVSKNCPALKNAYFAHMIDFMLLLGHDPQGDVRFQEKVKATLKQYLGKIIFNGLKIKLKVQVIGFILEINHETKLVEPMEKSIKAGAENLFL